MQKSRDWRLNNLERYKETKKKYYEANREKILKQQKEDRELNKKKCQEWYALNKDRINARRKESARIKKEQKQKEKEIQL